MVKLSGPNNQKIIKFVKKNELQYLRFIFIFSELMESIARFGLSAKDLMSQAAKRQQELTDPAMRDDLVI
jgi:catenin alpha